MKMRFDWRCFDTNQWIGKLVDRLVPVLNEYENRIKELEIKIEQLENNGVKLK